MKKKTIKTENPAATDTKSQKTGYLEVPFRLFSLSTTTPRSFQSHYHDFHKLLYFESGHVSYFIEGESYQLQPGDIVLVPAGQVHRPVVHDDTPYRRFIAYLSSDFFTEAKHQGSNLFFPFTVCSDCDSHVLRIRKIKENRIYPVLCELKYSCTSSFQTDADRILYQEALLRQLLLLLKMSASGADISFPAATGSNPQVQKILTYVNEHLTEALSTRQIAAACYLNPSYIMHLFRQKTGYTLGGYITEKRLFLARTLIQSGTPVTTAALESGFPSYSAFYRAYRNRFGESPSVLTRSNLD